MDNNIDNTGARPQQDANEDELHLWEYFTSNYDAEDNTHVERSMLLDSSSLAPATDRSGHHRSETIVEPFNVNVSAFLPLQSTMPITGSQSDGAYPQYATGGEGLHSNHASFTAHDSDGLPVSSLVFRNTQTVASSNHPQMSDETTFSFCRPATNCRAFVNNRMEDGNQFTRNVDPISQGITSETLARADSRRSSSSFDEEEKEAGCLQESDMSDCSRSLQAWTPAAPALSHFEAGDALSCSSNPPSHHRLHSHRCKPLTGYNYFYRDERDNIVGHLQNAGDPLPAPVSDFSASKMENLLHQHWYVDSVKGKRQHRKVHGKIAFPELSKVIAQRWKLLPGAGRDFYRQVARADHDEYERYLKDLRS